MQIFADSIGRTVEYAWPLMVQHNWAQHLSSIISGTILTIGLLGAWAIAYYNIPKLTCDDKECKLSILIVGCIFMAICLPIIIHATIVSHLPGLFYPEGDLINLLLNTYK